MDVNITPVRQDAWAGFARPGAVPMSYGEYLALPDDVHATGLVEWVDGVAIFHMPPQIHHQEIASYLTAVLRFFAQFFKLGTVLASPVEMRCGSDGPAREPDIVFVSKANLYRLTQQRLDGPADLAIEIVSDDSVKRDFDDKFFEYERCGVREYWIVDPRPNRQRAIFYQLTGEGKYESIKPDAGVYRSVSVPGFWLRVDWLWSMPDAQLTFAEIAGPDNIIRALQTLQAQTTAR